MKLFILLLILSVFINGCSSIVKEVCVNENCFFVEIADSDYERNIGLMNRTYLNENKGMLFIFDEEGIYSFWMKDTLINLDIIWINNNKEIVFIKNSAPICTKTECEIIIPNRKAKYVLEVNSMAVKELGIKMGNKVEFN